MGWSYHLVFGTWNLTPISKQRGIGIFGDFSYSQHTATSPSPHTSPSLAKQHTSPFNTAYNSSYTLTITYSPPTDVSFVQLPTYSSTNFSNPSHQHAISHSLHQPITDLINIPLTFSPNIQTFTSRSSANNNPSSAAISPSSQKIISIPKKARKR